MQRRPGAPAPTVRAHLSIMPPAQPTFHSALSAMWAQGSQIIIVTMSTTILGLQLRVNDLAMRILADVKSHGPELAAESVPENAVNEVAEEAKSDSETKDEKTPETPVTEPITNGSNTPESPKTESSPTDEPIPETPEDNDRPEPKAASPEPKAATPEPKAAMPEPEKLPVNGLSLEEPKVEAPEVPKCEESSVEKVTSETSESVPAPEIPVTKEVCVEQMPLIEPSPPPLPANPPPSSVASFAATTMAPELTDASLATPTDVTTTAAPIATTEPDPDTDIVDRDALESNTAQLDAEKAVAEVPTAVTETVEVIKAPIVIDEVKPEQVNIPTSKENGVIDSNVDAMDGTKTENVATDTTPALTIVPDHVDIPEIVINESQPTNDLTHHDETDDQTQQDDDTYAAGDKEIISDKKIVEDKKIEEVMTTELSATTTEIENLKNSAKVVEEDLTEKKCNGLIEEEKNEAEITPADKIGEATTQEDSMPPPPPLDSQGDEVSDDAEETLPLPPCEPCPPPPATPPTQDVLPVSDKMADLIPEIPVVPELKTEMESSSDVAVIN
ncbi:hypothetical protein RR48_06391 [Papilio machaon]|uniref:Uncharacterized protein n=1 Tax=Papilio machaon TaxID=76193 RepID=A0A194R827_PAPMA|nr:hypothetical protein RR48_06391 [Papilio machaon]